jgi:uncharacterized protein
VEKLLMHGVFGGTPRYHALVDPSHPPAEEIVTLLMQPLAILENEVRFLLGSEQIRDPAPCNAILAAIAGGETKFNGIRQLIGVERGALSKSLRTLLELGWIRRELPFDERSDRRALYRVADPFLAFWYRFVAPLASDLQFSDPAAVYAAHIASRPVQYMGWAVFEESAANGFSGVRNSISASRFARWPGTGVGTVHRNCPRCRIGSRSFSLWRMQVAR